MKYYISDLHLFHDAVIGFDQRPFKSMEEMHEVIRERWNSKITNGDIVYILGDISMRGKSEKLISYVSVLKGQKILVTGNHDDVSDYRFKQLFREICDYKELHDTADGHSQDVVLCHYPIFSWRNMGHGAVLLYGHTHNSPEDEFYQKGLREMYENDTRKVYHTAPRAINVGCMKPWMDYEPRTLDELWTQIR